MHGMLVSMDAEELATRWRERLESWAIPEEILAKAPADPWSHSPERFGTRTDRALAEPDAGPTMTRLAEALPDQGTVLDVGAGAGAPPPQDASAKLAPSISRRRRRSSVRLPSMASLRVFFD